MKIFYLPICGWITRLNSREKIRCQVPMDQIFTCTAKWEEMLFLGDGWYPARDFDELQRKPA
jgi:hypothetical protein